MTTTFKLNVAESVISDKTISTDADATAVSDSSPTITKNDPNTRQFYVSRLFPTLNTGGSNTSTTLDILNINTTNTATTGVTTNLLHLLYGGSSLFKFGSAGDLFVGGSAGTSGHFLKSQGAGSPVVWAAASGGGVTIGDSIASATQGSILFAGAAGVLAQDNTNLFWDDTNNRLGLGTASPASPLDILPVTVLAQSTGYVSGITLGGTFTRNTAGAATYAVQQIKPTFNFGGSNTLTTVNVLSVDTVNTSITGLTACNLLKLSYNGTQMGAVDSTGLFITNGVRTVIEGVATWKDSGGSKAVATGMKVPGGSITDDFILSTWSGSAWTERMRVANSSGLATFANAVTITGALTVDTNTLYVDATNNRVGIGTTGPTMGLDINQSVSGTSLQHIKNTNTGGYSATVYRNSSGTLYFGVGYGNSGVAAPHTSVPYLDFPGTLTFIPSGGTAIATLEQTGLLTISPTTVTTAADQFVNGLSIGGSFTKSNGDTRQFYVQQIKPTFNFGGGNSATTVDILSIDSTNTATTGLTANLINAKYGGTSQFKVSSAGVVTTVGEITVGNSLVQSGNNSAMEMKGWAADSGSAIGAKFGSGNAFTTNGAILMQIHNAGTQKAAITKTGAYNPDFTDDSATTGDRTVNTPCGKNAFGTAATAVQITNSCVKSTSLVFAQLMTNDGALIKCVEISDGSFIVRLNTATSGTVVFGWIVFNGN